MAETTYQELDPYFHELTIEITPDDYLPLYDKLLKQIALQSNLQGFRKGKVPKSLIRRQHGRSVLIEAIEETFNNQIEQVLKEKSSLFILNQLMVEENLSQEVQSINPIKPTRTFKQRRRLGIAEFKQEDFQFLDETDTYENLVIDFTPELLETLFEQQTKDQKEFVNIDSGIVEENDVVRLEIYSEIKRDTESSDSPTTAEDAQALGTEKESTGKLDAQEETADEGENSVVIIKYIIRASSEQHLDSPANFSGLWYVGKEIGTTFPFIIEEQFGEWDWESFRKFAVFEGDEEMEKVQSAFERKELPLTAKIINTTRAVLIEDPMEAYRNATGLEDIATKEQALDMIKVHQENRLDRLNNLRNQQWALEKLIEKNPFEYSDEWLIESSKQLIREHSQRKTAERLSKAYVSTKSSLPEKVVLRKARELMDVKPTFDEVRLEASIDLIGHLSYYNNMNQYILAIEELLKDRNTYERYSLMAADSKILTEMVMRATPNNRKLSLTEFQEMEEIASKNDKTETLEKPEIPENLSWGEEE